MRSERTSRHTFRSDARGVHPVIAIFLLFAVVLIVGAVATTFVIDFDDDGGTEPAAPTDEEFGCLDGRLVYAEGPTLRYLELFGVTGPADQIPWEPGDGATIDDRSELRVVWVGPESNESVILFDGCT